MCIRPLNTLEAIWNCSTWLILAGSKVIISATPAQAQRRCPPWFPAANADFGPNPGNTCANVKPPAAAINLSVVRRVSAGPLISSLLRLNRGSFLSKS